MGMEREAAAAAYRRLASGTGPAATDPAAEADWNHRANLLLLAARVELAERRLAEEMRRRRVAAGAYGR